MSSLSIGNLTDKVTLDIAKPMIIQLAKERIGRVSLIPTEEQLLRLIVTERSVPPNVLAAKMGKSASFISKILASLMAAKLISVKIEGRHRIYAPVLDAEIAYSE
ncbi:MAG: hypothetical protein NTV32_08345 [Gammaproteobacteria bacterium]|nr:hypothetical protein [Gammaproteobacteria bacterium]